MPGTPLSRQEIAALAERAGIPVTEDRLEAFLAAAPFANDILATVWRRECALESEPAHMFAPRTDNPDTDR